MDITRIIVDVIVNPANSAGIGCFKIGHKCLDNVIHQKAGPRLREECTNILNKSSLETSHIIVTKGYNLPSKYVFHTVGPIWKNNMTHEKKKIKMMQPRNCYVNCITRAERMHLNSIAIPCISTGVFSMPKELSAKIAIKTVLEWKGNVKIILCTYTDEDYKIYINIIK